MHFPTFAVDRLACNVLFVLNKFCWTVFFLLLLLLLFYVESVVFFFFFDVDDVPKDPRLFVPVGMIQPYAIRKTKKDKRC